MFPTEKGGRVTITYAYNPEQRLAEAITPKAKVEYKYDPLGRRIEKSVNSSPVRYVYDNEDIIAMLDGNNTLIAAFTHGPGIDEPLIMTRPDGANYFYHADGLGSIVALTDDKGETAQTINYQSYGKPVTVIYDPAAAPNPYYFTARELDAETGLYYYRARYYDWQRGAFTQEDPIGFESGDHNLYSYVFNQPSRYTDAFGLRISIDSSLVGDYYSVKATLSQAIPEVRDLFDRLEKSNNTYKIVSTPEAGYSRASGPYFNPITKTIFWNPRVALASYKGFGGISPATILIHELTHARNWEDNWIKYIYTRLVPNKDYDNLQERYIIQGLEGRVSSSLKQGIRFDHGGCFNQVGSVFAIK